MKNKVKQPLKRRFFCACVLFAAILCLVLTILIYFSYKQGLYHQYDLKIKDILNYTSSQIDVDDLELCIKTGEESEKFRELQTFLDGVKDNVDLDYLYIIIPLNTNETDNIQNVIAGVSKKEYENESDSLMYLNQLTGDSYSPETAKKYLDAYESDEITCFLENSEWGVEYTGLKPLYDSDGNKVAALCVDVNVDGI